MLVVKDAMVIIHFAKANVLRESCAFFHKVYIPELVLNEVIKGEFQDTKTIRDCIEQNLLQVKKIVNKKFISLANQYNIFRGEAEAVALCWELKADALATDDYQVRKKESLLKIKIVGTPALLLWLYREKALAKEQLIAAIQCLRSNAWINSTVWDKIQLEVEK